MSVALRLPSALLAALTVIIPSVASAQKTAGGEPQLYADLNGNGRAERFWLHAGGDTNADLVIEGTGSETVQVPDLVWFGNGAGTGASLELAANGSVVVRSGNEGVGRDRWMQVLTIAWHDGGYRIAGYTMSTYDTLDLTHGGTCDVNLLTSRGVVTVDDETTTFRTGIPAPFVEDWSVGVGVLPGCSAISY